MAIKERMSGKEAVAYAIRQVNPDVMPAFPITPSTEIPQMVSTYIANGEMDTEFIPVESEPFFHECCDRSRGSRCKKLNSHLFRRSGADVGGAFAGCIKSYAVSTYISQQNTFRTDQYQL